MYVCAMNLMHLVVFEACWPHNVKRRVDRLDYSCAMLYRQPNRIITILFYVKMPIFLV